MKIEVTQLLETKSWSDGIKQYKSTYNNGYPVVVRRVSRCTNCKVEIGGYFGNKVYRYQDTSLCQGCGEICDPVVQESIVQTGMTPVGYQSLHGRAWNE